MVMAVVPTRANPKVVTTGGTAVSYTGPPMNGCYITNPVLASDQGIATAENLYIDPTGAAATLIANGSCVAIAPGQTWRGIPGMTTNISINAATSGHSFTFVRW